MFLEYDDPREGVFLRFLGVRDFGIVPGNWYEDAYLWGATLAFAGDGGLVWLSDELFREETIEGLKDRTCWVRADRIIWAISNADGEPGEMPSGKLTRFAASTARLSRSITASLSVMERGSSCFARYGGAPNGTPPYNRALVMQCGAI